MVTDVAQWTDHTRRGVDAMEPLRMKWLMLSTISWVIVIVGAGATCLVYSSHQHDPAPAWITAGGALVAALVFHAMASAQSKLLQTRFDQWRAKTVSMIDDTASFAARNGIPQSDFDGSGLNDATYNRYSSWDQLHVGSVRSGALSVKHVYQETYWVTEYHTDSQGRSQSR